MRLRPLFCTPFLYYKGIILLRSKCFVDSKDDNIDTSSGRKRSSSRSSRNEELSEEPDAQTVTGTRPEREDHRLSGSGYRNGHGTTSRLHDHIRSREQDSHSPDGSIAVSSKRFKLLEVVRACEIIEL